MGVRARDGSATVASPKHSIFEVARTFYHMKEPQDEAVENP